MQGLLILPTSWWALLWRQDCDGHLDCQLTHFKKQEGKYTFGYMNKCVQSRGNWVREESHPECWERGSCLSNGASWTSQMWASSLLPPWLLIYGPCPGDCTSDCITVCPFSFWLQFCQFLKGSHEKRSWYKDQIIYAKHLVLCVTQNRHRGHGVQNVKPQMDPWRRNISFLGFLGWFVWNLAFPRIFQVECSVLSNINSWVTEPWSLLLYQDVEGSLCKPSHWCQWSTSQSACYDPGLEQFLCRVFLILLTP